MMTIRPNVRLLARLLRELLRTESFADLADLADALKGRCARLRIPWTVDDLTDALWLVGTNTRLTTNKEASWN